MTALPSRRSRRGGETPVRRPRSPRPGPLVRLSWYLHAGVALTALARPRRWRPLLKTLLVNHAALSVAGLLPRSSLLCPNLTRLPDPGDDQVALTFDDGPDPHLTPQVLARLEAGGHRATFFCIGERAIVYQRVLREVVARGHRVENHTFSHPRSFAFSLRRSLDREVGRSQEVLARLTGRPPAWFRAPAGVQNPLLEACLARHGLRLASWTRRGLDTIDPDPRRILRRITRNLQPGDVLVLHDGREQLAARTELPVLEVLPPLLERLEEAGLTSVPLPEPAPETLPAERVDGPRGVL